MRSINIRRWWRVSQRQRRRTLRRGVPSSGPGSLATARATRPTNRSPSCTQSPAPTSRSVDDLDRSILPSLPLPGYRSVAAHPIGRTRPLDCATAHDGRRSTCLSDLFCEVSPVGMVGDDDGVWACCHWRRRTRRGRRILFAMRRCLLLRLTPVMWLPKRLLGCCRMARRGSGRRSLAVSCSGLSQTLLVIITAALRGGRSVQPRFLLSFPTQRVMTSTRSTTTGLCLRLWPS